MPAIYSTAPGKIILCGEHAVVYGKPAIALPVNQVWTKTAVFAKPGSVDGEIHIIAPGVGLDTNLSSLSRQNPLQRTITLVKEELHLNNLPACEIRITTSIPIGAGLGSSAAVTVSLARALAKFLGHPLPNETINRIAYEVERIHHGTPSGIDNTVITLGAPILFQKGAQVEPLEILKGFTLMIADSGFTSATVEMVDGVRIRREQNQPKYDHLFEEIAKVTLQVYDALCHGDILQSGSFLSENHLLLREIGVSTPLLDEMVSSALSAGASGAKLSGGGGGGNVLAVVAADKIDRVSAAFLACGARNIITTTIQGKIGAVDE